MNFDFSIEMSRYKEITKTKELNPEFINSGTLFDQKVLTACGAIHARLMLLPDNEQIAFKAENTEFFDSFAWLYYTDWREARAKCCASLLDTYKLLNVELHAQHLVGETFYAGIPLVTNDEINAAIDKYATPDKQYGDEGVVDGIPNIWMEKVGIDGRLHPTNSKGEFKEMTDINDIYADGTMVSLVELNNYDPLPRSAYAKPKCYSCVNRNGDGVACVDINEFTCYLED